MSFKYDQDSLRLSKAKHLHTQAHAQSLGFIV